MSGIFELIISNPKEALSAGHQAIELIKKLRERSKKDPSINAILMELEKGCHETSLAFRNKIRDFKKYCEDNKLDTSKNLDQLYNDASWMRLDRKISLAYTSRQINSLAYQFGQFVEDATAVLNCYEKGSVEEGRALSRAVMRRKDVEGMVNINMPVGQLIDNLIKLSDELHSEFHAG
jgi:hypothetical protein